MVKVWSPWYVEIMKDLDIMYGKEGIDTPVSENAVTGAAIGASLCMKPIVVHPRMDFLLYAMDT